MSNRAWVTLATNDSYSLGALVLAHSLRRVGSTYPAVILITPSVTDAMRERLRAVFADVIVVDVLDSRDATHLALLQRPELGITFTKIHCWSLTQFEKCIFLDADTLVVQNCDELFEREELSAAPDVGWPDCFNSGVFVYRPSQATFDALIQFAKQRGSFDGGDQGLLNSYFSSWAHGDINKHLPFLYNVTSAAFYSYLPALKHFGQDLKIIHFIGAAKPWLQTYNWESHSVDSAGHLKDTLQLWWEIFVSSVHRQLDVTMVVEGGPPELPPNDTVNYYVPEVDPDSIFPWHHVNPTLPQEEEQQPIDLSMYYDPWVLYPGDIPLSNEILQTTDSQIPGRVEVTQELRDYIWEYKSKQTAPSISCAHDTPDLHLSEPSGSNYEHSHQHSHLSDSQHSPLSDHQHSHLSDSQHSHLSDNQHSHLSDNQHSHLSDNQHSNLSDNQLSHLSDDLLPLLQHESYLSHHQHGHSYKSNFSHQHGRHLHHRDQSQQQQHHHHHHQDYHQQEKKDHSHTGSTWTKETQVKSLNDQPVHRYDTHSPTSHGDHREIAQVHHARIEAPKKSLKATKKKIKRLHRIDLGNEKAVTNGDLSSEDEEVLEIEPRHPYDGFYLRHRATIDPYGRKICTHQIPPTPPPTPPPESPEPTLTDEEEIQDLLDSQTGVAGNLARVVPGAISSQREALDELTRRQGWEAGNIDYLGADSFDNIWAKISQTLNQSPKQPSPPKEAVPVLKDPTPPKETTPAPKQPSPPKQLPAKPPTPPKEQPIKDPSPVKQPSPPKEEPVAAEPIVEEIPATVEAVLAESVPTEARTVAPVEIIPAAAEPPKQESAIPAVTEKAKNEPVMPATPPVTPSDTASTTPVTETAPVVETPAPVVEKPDLVEVPKIPELDLLESSQSDKEVTPKKTLELSTTSTDSPPLANTPSKEEITTQQAAKSEGEKARKPTGKLQLSPPVATDPLPTPDSEVEDAASLAQSIIASELATPTVTSPTPPAPLTPASPPPALQQKRLSVDEPLPATPPAGPVSLAQIGVKPKPSIASQIESSITDKVETATPPETPTTPTSPSEPGTPTEVPKKKMVKKSVKKEAVTVAGAETPVPPPRKKEKKPKDK